MARRPGPRDASSQQPSDARAFFRVGVQRLEDARFLLENSRPTAAVYLAGYSVECTLKALLLSTVPRAQAVEILESFRGNLAHDFGWLRGRYLQRGGASFPKEILKCLLIVRIWDTDLRYQSVALRMSEAEAFFRATEQIVRWSEGRI